MINKVLFLINPTSGIGSLRTIEKLIESELDESKIKSDIAYTKYRGHALELAAAAVGKYNVVVAVGGDGTVNEIASRLIGTDTSLAIVPTGSGNGLARYLGIPLRAQKAIQALNYMKIKSIDTLKVNQYHSVNVAGIGFDAHISHGFAKRKLRGPLSYAQLVAAELAKYQSHNYKLTIDGKVEEKKIFLLSFANSSQYGNNIHIAPDAKIDDGFVDVCVIKKFPKIIAPAVLLSLLGKVMEKNDFEKITRAKKVEIESDEDVQGHIDGEPVYLGKKIIVELIPHSLNIIIPPDSLVHSWIDPFVDVIPKIEGFMCDFFNGKK